MAEAHNLFSTLQTFTYDDGKAGQYYSLPQLETEGVGPISRLPVSLRIVLESVLRNYDGKRISENDIRTLANWQPNTERTAEIPFVVARIVLQDFTGVPLLVDLAAMRSAVAPHGAQRRHHRAARPRGSGHRPLGPGGRVTKVPSDALQRNMEIEFKRNRARYQFLKWGTQAFHGFSRRAARNRHSASGQLRISGERRPPAKARCSTRTLWSAPTLTRP